MSETARAHRTLTRRELWKAVSGACPTLSLEDARASVDIILEEITEALLRGETVKLTSFGVFRIVSKGERIGRNPKTGVEATITPRRVVFFKASRILIDKMKGGTPGVRLRKARANES